MAINLDGIVQHDAEICVVGKDAFFITSTNQSLLSEALAMPFNTSYCANTNKKNSRVDRCN